MVTGRRRGLSRIECLVVFAIVIVLGGLLAPAIQEIKETRLRTECQNNLRQVGMAAHNFLSTCKFLPSNPGSSGQHTGTVQWLLIPYLE
jgi:hypothetical protein